LITYEDNLQSGEFIRYQQKANNYIGLAVHNATNHYKDSYIKLGDNKVLISHSISGEGCRVTTALYDDITQKISYPSNGWANVSTTIREGDGSKLCKLRDDKAVIFTNSDGNATAYRLLGRVVSINANGTVNVHPYVVLDSATRSGFNHDAHRITDDSLLLIHRIGGTGADEAGTVAEIISVSDTNTLVKKSLLKLSSSLGRRPNLSLIKENNDEAYFLVTGVATSSNNGISGMVIKVNKSSLAISIEVSEFLIDNSVNSGNSMNTHLLDEDGKYKVVIFHNEGSNLSMNITIFELDYTNLSYLSNTKKKQNILPIANSGTLTATSLGTTVHSEIYMGKGIFLMVYRNGNSLEHSQININDTIITIMKTSRIGTGEVWRFPMIMDFENRNYAVFHSNSSTTNGVSLVVPETNVRKAYPESTCVGGVTNSSGSFPSELEIIVPK